MKISAPILSTTTLVREQPSGGRERKTSRVWFPPPRSSPLPPPGKAAPSFPSRALCLAFLDALLAPISATSTLALFSLSKFAQYYAKEAPFSAPTLVGMCRGQTLFTHAYRVPPRAIVSGWGNGCKRPIAKWKMLTYFFDLLASINEWLRSCSKNDKIFYRLHSTLHNF